MDGCQVLFPNERVPKSIVHFIGGFIAGSAVRASYESLLEAIAASKSLVQSIILSHTFHLSYALFVGGHVVVATELPPFERDHAKGTLLDNCS
jgi:hypothetical protein